MGPTLLRTPLHRRLSGATAAEGLSCRCGPATESPTNDRLAEASADGAFASLSASGDPRLLARRELRRYISADLGGLATFILTTVANPSLPKGLNSGSKANTAGAAPGR